MKNVILIFMGFIHVIFWLIIFIRNYLIGSGLSIFFSIIFWVSMLIAIIIMVVTVRKLYSFQKLEYQIRLAKELNEMKEKQKKDVELSIRKENEKMKENLEKLEIILEMLKKQDTRTAKEEFGKLYHGIQNKDIVYYCNNSYINAVLYNKKLLAQQYNIPIHYDIRLPDHIDLYIIDLPTVLFNILDNGINACKECMQKHLMLTVKYNDKYICVYQKNSSIENSIKYDKTGLHGYGLKIVEEIVEKYDGYCDWSVTDGCFESRIMIKYKKEDFNYEICNS